MQALVRGVHSECILTLASAPFAYFQHTDTGSILNRFIQDMELIDFALPVFALNFIEGHILFSSPQPTGHHTLTNPTQL